VEQVWNGLWPLQAILAALLALGFSGLLPALGPWLHSALLAASLAWLGWTLWQKRQAWRLPAWSEASRRLEHDSGVSHRPLQGLDDEPLGNDPAAMALWAAHQAQLAARLKALKPKAPTSDLPRLDRFAFRAGAMQVLVVALFLAGNDAWFRMGQSFQPNFAGAPAAPPVVDVWIEPPEYTNAPPVFAQLDKPELTVPVGSTLVARVSNGSAPVLTLDAESHSLTEEAAGRHSLKLTVNQGSKLTLLDGAAPLATWSITMLPDEPPEAMFSGPPSATERGATRIDYLAADDYGVAEAWVELTLLDPEPDEAPGKTAAKPTREPIRLQVLLGDTALPLIDGALFQDLTPHPWAGSTVSVRLFAKDAAGQEAASETETLTLAEREFTHPVAQAIIAQRKRLDEGEEFFAVAKGLLAIATQPGAFEGDVVVFLGLSASFNRLRLNDRDSARAETKETVRNLLWDIALRLEDGGLPAAERELRAAQRALQEALARNAPDEEINRLVERLRQALREFAREMAQRTPQAPENTDPNAPQNVISGENLEKMLDRIRELSQTGARDAAQQLLAQMQQMLENLRSAQMSPEQQRQAQKMMQQMHKLDELRRRQQDLMDQTFQQNQQNRPTQSGPPRAGQQGQRPRPGQQGQPDQQGEPMPGLAQQQEQLRRDLGELMRELGEGQGGIPQPMQNAEGAMRSAQDALQQGNGQGAMGAEGEALRQLQEAAQDMANQFSQQLGQGQGQGQGRQSGGQGGEDGQGSSGMDPLGRDGNGNRSATEGVRVPDEFDIQRARRIRDELYRRSADPARPAVEQDYLRRLLERF
jgi:uncharacterized protein (TIGR02302 family)